MKKNCLTRAVTFLPKTNDGDSIGKKNVIAKACLPPSSCRFCRAPLAECNPKHRMRMEAIRERPYQSAPQSTKQHKREGECIRMSSVPSGTAQLETWKRPSDSNHHCEGDNLTLLQTYYTCISFSWLIHTGSKQRKCSSR